MLELTSKAVLDASPLLALASDTGRHNKEVLVENVRIWEEELTLPAYRVGPDDPLPPFRRRAYWRIYPYPMQDDLTRERTERTFRAVCLENEYLKAVVLPELGGHLYSLQDKATGREVFYRNNVFKPGLVALRGAWVSGGIEFNFPVGHSVTTVSPVDWAVRKNPDGSATVFVGDLERVSRMKWLVGITLYPGKAFVEIGVRLFNRTPVRHRFYFWVNAAVPATEGLRFVCPARTVRGRGIWSFPVHEGVDISWYRNHPRPVDLFALDSKEDFFGYYDYEGDAGAVHIADFRECVGKKFFTWGTADSGLIWAEILSDEDGPYCEVQSGRFLTQEDWEFLPPHGTETWREWWYPVWGIGGFWRANLQAAVNLEVEDGRASLGVYVPEPLPNARIELLRGGRVLVQWGTNLAPDRPFRAEVPVDAEERLALRVLAGEREVFSCTLEPPEAGKPPEIPTERPEEELSTEELCVKARGHEKRQEEDEAERLYKKALEKDPGFSPAHKGLGTLRYKAGRLREAEEHLRRASDRSPHDPEVHYLLGAVLKELGDLSGAEDELWAAFRDRGCGPPALYILAELAAGEGDYGKAEGLLRRVLALDPEDVRAWGLLAAVLRLQGRAGEASDVAREALDRDPLDLLASWELWRATGREEDREAFRRLLRGEVQLYLELASDYEDAGLWGEAVQVLQEALDAAPEHPLVYYHLGYCLEQAGENGGEYYERARKAPPDYVFPHRLEDMRALERALEQDPGDARAAYYLGNLLFARGREGEAVELWKRATRSWKYFVLRRNLGVAYWKRGELERAMREYDEAVRLAPREFRLYLERDDLLKEAGKTPGEQLGRLSEAPPEVQANWKVAGRTAALCVEVGEYDRAVRLLESHTFLPWEGEVAMRSVYVGAYLGRGEERFRAGRYREALEDFLRASEYPRNIGMGRPPEPRDAGVWYWIGAAYETLGEGERAWEAYERAAFEVHPSDSPLQYERGRALKKLGRDEKARECFEGLVKAGQAREDAQGHYIRGLGLLGLGKEAEAKEAFRRALELDPDHREARRMLQGTSPLTMASASSRP
ncbi:MAG TPA: DUF5107 domain-containing protein [Candidatus Latescibacteria bacterium]|nr:DUF5107 domain-containing protein [Candidatus Latescibacterota bacterium]